jgi:hypothetical protein
MYILAPFTCATFENMTQDSKDAVMLMDSIRTSMEIKYPQICELIKL